MTDFEPTKWTDYRTHLIGHGRHGVVTLTGAQARKKRKELKAAKEAHG